MRIVLVGQGPFAEKVLEALAKKKETIIGLFTLPDKRGDAPAVLAEKAGIPVFRPKKMKDPEVFEIFNKLKPDLSILAFVTDILPEKLLFISALGTICYHPSLLPRHRGASGIHWAIIQGETRTGLTIFWVDKGIDTGPILLQKEVDIGPEDTTGSLYFNKLFPIGVEAMVEAVELIKEGKAPKIPQDESKATYEPPCDDRVAQIDFNKSLKEIYNLIRGCDPQPGAFTFLRGNKVRFFEAKILSGHVEIPQGEVLTIEEKGLNISAQGGVLQVGKIRVDRGEKMGAVEFAQTFGLKVGDRFGT
ncbi:MAG: methionyl-tRNA formyltransferase [Thermodesulfobacteriota bacterium]